MGSPPARNQFSGRKTSQVLSRPTLLPGQAVCDACSEVRAHNSRRRRKNEPQCLETFPSITNLGSGLEWTLKMAPD